MGEVAASMAMIIFGIIVILILLYVLVQVHRQAKHVEELKRQLKLTEQAREEKEKQNG